MGNCAFCQNFREWIAQPFSVDMSALDWLLFIGLLLVAMIIWRIVLHTVEEALS